MFVNFYSTPIHSKLVTYPKLKSNKPNIFDNGLYSIRIKIYIDQILLSHRPFQFLPMEKTRFFVSTCAKNQLEISIGHIHWPDQFKKHIYNSHNIISYIYSIKGSIKMRKHCSFQDSSYKLRNTRKQKK